MQGDTAKSILLLQIIGVVIIPRKVDLAVSEWTQEIQGSAVNRT